MMWRVRVHLIMSTIYLDVLCVMVSGSAAARVNQYPSRHVIHRDSLMSQGFRTLRLLITRVTY